MTRPQWNRIQEIFHAALAMPRSEREAYVAKTCEGDPVLLREVKSLLAAHDSLKSFLETPVVELGAKSFSGSDQAVTSLADTLLGTTIDGRYLIESELGRGAFGRVYRASALELHGRWVVIKVLSEGLLRDSDARQRFKQEIEALSRIDHPGVVGVLGAGELADGRPYIAMQYIEGETLRSQIPSEGMNLERAASILKQIGAALDHAHQKGVFHRDLKPTNIMIKRDTDSVVLVDFGVAKVQDSLAAPSTVTGATVGTVLYMSPEQLRGERITAASDIYSMSVVAYETVTGRRPFNPASASQLLAMQRKRMDVKPIKLRPNLPPQAQDIILRGLSFRPSARYQNAKQFGDSLAHALVSKVNGVNKQWLYVLLIVLGVAILSVGAYKYLSRNGEVPPPNRSFSYFLTVQRMRNGQPYQTPFKSHGEETFESGDKFQLTVSTPVPAYLYIFNEGPAEPNHMSFRMIYPRQAINNGSASLGANQSVQSDWITFRGPAGAENFWIAWSTSPVSELDAATSEAFKHPDGGLTGQTLVTVKQYLAAKESEIDATTYNYNANQTAVVRARRDMLVALAQFKHR